MKKGSKGKSLIPPKSVEEKRNRKVLK